MTSHELHKADGVGVARGLDVGHLNCLPRHSHGGVEAKAAVQKIDVIVDRLRNADDGAFPADALHLLLGLVGALLRPVSPQYEVLPNALLPQRLGHIDVRRVATWVRQLLQS